MIHCFQSVWQYKAKGGAASSLGPSTSNRLITSLKRCVYHVDHAPKVSKANNTAICKGGP